jgi:hypothetical protein
LKVKNGDAKYFRSAFDIAFSDIFIAYFGLNTFSNWSCQLPHQKWIMKRKEKKMGRAFTFWWEGWLRAVVKSWEIFSCSFLIVLLC